MHTRRAVKTTVPGLPDSGNRVVLQSFVSSEYQRVTYRQTDTPPIAKSHYSIDKCDQIMLKKISGCFFVGTAYHQ